LLQDALEPELLRRKNVSHATDDVGGYGPSGAHRGDAFAIRPVIVGKHPQKIFAVHKSFLPRDASLSAAALRLAA